MTSPAISAPLQFSSHMLNSKEEGLRSPTSPAESATHHPNPAIAPMDEPDHFAMQEFGDQVDEYYFGVRIFPGQDPAQVWVGWVTPHYHSYSPTTREFNPQTAVRKCLYNEMDHHGMVAES